MQIEWTPFDLHVVFRFQPLDHTLADITPRSDVIGEDRQFEIHVFFLIKQTVIAHEFLLSTVPPRGGAWGMSVRFQEGISPKGHCLQENIAVR